MTGLCYPVPDTIWDTVQRQIADAHVDVCTVSHWVCVYFHVTVTLTSWSQFKCSRYSQPQPAVETHSQPKMKKWKKGKCDKQVTWYFGALAADGGAVAAGVEEPSAASRSVHTVEAEANERLCFSTPCMFLKLPDWERGAAFIHLHVRKHGAVWMVCWGESGKLLVGRHSLHYSPSNSEHLSLPPTLWCWLQCCSWRSTNNHKKCVLHWFTFDP